MVVLDRAGPGFRANIVEKFVMMSVVLHVAVHHKNTVQHVSLDPEMSTITGSFAARQGPSVLDRARSPDLCGYYGVSK